MTEQNEIVVPVDPTVDPALTQEFALPQDSLEAELAARVADLNAERRNLAMLFREVRYEYTSKNRLRDIALAVLTRYNFYLGTAVAAAEELRQQDAPAQDSAQAENARLRKAIKDAADNLGVPQPGYPAPVTEAVRILRSAEEAPRVGA